MNRFFSNFTTVVYENKHVRYIKPIDQFRRRKSLFRFQKSILDN